MPRPTAAPLACRLAALPLVLACASAGPGTPAGPVIVSVEITGAHALSSGEILARLATVPTPCWPWAEKSRFDPARLRSDLLRIRTLYEAHGYFAARVVETAVEPAGRGSVRVRIVVDEGPPSCVTSLAIEGLADLPAATRAALLGKLPLVLGDIFTDRAFRAARAALESRLAGAGYVGSTVTPAARVEPSSHSVAVTYAVVHGPRYRFGAIEVHGEKVVSAARVAAEVRSALAPGAPYRQEDLAEAQRRVFSLGVFSAAHVEHGTPDPGTGTVPVEVRVREAPFHTLRFGAGLGVDVEHQELHAIADYTDRDFLGGLRRLDFDNRFALVWIPSVFAPAFAAAAPAGRSSVALTQPDLFTRGLDLAVQGGVERAVEQGYDYWAFTGRLAIPWRPTRRLTLTATYALGDYLFQNGFNGIDLSPNALLQTSCPTNGAQGSRCLLSYLEQALAWDGRDDPIEPRRGLYFALLLQEGGGPLGGDFTYLKLSPDLRLYIPLGPTTVLALRVQAGELIPYGGVAGPGLPGGPVTERFYAGGIDSVRGYGAMRLSPMARVNTCAVLPCHNPGNSLGVVDVPVGGDELLLGNLEVRQKLSTHWQLAFFVDAGEVNPTAWSADLSPEALAVTPGVGLRITTPVGPIRVDFAYRVTEPIRPVVSSFGLNPPIGPSPPTAAIDTCPYPYFLVPQTGWAAGGNPYARPSTCVSPFLNHFIPSIAIGEAF